MVPSIVFDQENYTIQYGTDMTMLVSSSNLVQGSSDTSVVNGDFSVNITGLTPFTRYYYIIVATNSVGSTSTTVMNFITGETGRCIHHSQVYHFSGVIFLHSTQYSPYELSALSACSHNI